MAAAKLPAMTAAKLPAMTAAKQEHLSWDSVALQEAYEERQVFLMLQHCMRWETVLKAARRSQEEGMDMDDGSSSDEGSEGALSTMTPSTSASMERMSSTSVEDSSWDFEDSTSDTSSNAEFDTNGTKQDDVKKRTIVSL
jgi:hypothetical protein